MKMLAMALRLVPRTLVAVSVALFAWGSDISVAQETIVVFDGFDDGNRTNSPDGINWFSHSHDIGIMPMTVVDDSAGLGSGNALLVEPITSSTSMMGVFDAPISLGEEVGSKLTLRFEMRNETNLPQVPRTVRWGLYDARALDGVDIIEENFPDPAGFGGMDGDWDQSDPGSYFDPGVWVQQDNSLLLTCCFPSATRVREEPNTFPPFFAGDPPTGNLLFGVDDRNNAAPAAGESFPGLAQPEGKNIFTLELERVAPGSESSAWNVTYTLDNGIDPPASLSGPHLGPEFFAAEITNTGTYDYFAFFLGGTFPGDGGVDDGFAHYLIDNFSISVTGTGVQPLAGDYNGDETVNAADYTLYRDNLGIVVDFPGRDPALEGLAVGQGDYLYWKERFGNTAGSGSAAVPEPTGLTLLLSAMTISVIAMRKRTCRSR